MLTIIKAINRGLVEGSFFLIGIFFNYFLAGWTFFKYDSINREFGKKYQNIVQRLCQKIWQAQPVNLNCIERPVQHSKNCQGGEIPRKCFINIALAIFKNNVAIEKKADQNLRGYDEYIGNFFFKMKYIHQKKIRKDPPGKNDPAE